MFSVEGLELNYGPDFPNQDIDNFRKSELITNYSVKRHGNGRGA